MYNIKEWSKKDGNANLFMALSIIAVMLTWFIPYIVISVVKYGWLGIIPRYHVFLLIGMIFLSMWVGFKFTMKFL